MPYTVALPDGRTVEFPDSVSREEAAAIIRRQFGGGPQPESGFGAAFRSGIQGLMGAGAALAGRTGLMDMEEAQRAVDARRKRQEEIFKPTEEWGITKLTELLGGSIPYMAAPLAAAGAAAALPVTGPAAVAAGLGAAGLASATQFTGTNLSRQIEEGKKLAETDLGNAALAAVPMALLDTLALRMLPGVGKLLGDAGIKVTKETAKDVSEQILKKAAIDYAAATGRAMTVEGLTEAAQQGFERLQAGLNIADADARKEYFDALVGGALLGGAIAPVGRSMERGKAKREIAAIEQEEADKQAAAAREAETKRKQDPAYLEGLNTTYQELLAQKNALTQQLKKGTKEAPLSQEDIDANAVINEQLRALKQPFERARKEFISAGGPQALAKLREGRLELTPPPAETPAAPEEPEAPEAQRARLTQDVAKLTALLDQQREAILKAATPEEALQVAQRAQQTYEALTAANTELGKMPTVPTQEALKKQEAELLKKFEAARDKGDQQAVLDIVPKLQAVRKQLAEAAPFDLTSEEYAAEEDRKRAALGQAMGEGRETALDNRRQTDIEQQFAREQDAKSAALQAQLDFEGQAEREALTELAASRAADMRARELQPLRTAPQLALFPEAQGRVARAETPLTPSERPPEMLPLRAELARLLAEKRKLERARVRPQAGLPATEVVGPFTLRTEATNDRIREIDTRVAEIEEQLTGLTQRAVETRSVVAPPDKPQPDTRPQEALPQRLNALAERVLASPQVDEETKELVRQVQDNLPALLPRAEVGAWLYRTLQGTAPPDLTQDIRNRLAELEAGRRSETEQETQRVRRPLTADERKAVAGTSLQEQRTVVQPQPTGETRRAVQTELDMPEPSATAFETLKEFQDYLASDTLAAARGSVGPVRPTAERLERQLEVLRQQAAKYREDQRLLELASVALRQHVPDVVQAGAPVRSDPKALDAALERLSEANTEAIRAAQALLDNQQAFEAQAETASDTDFKRFLVEDTKRYFDLQQQLRRVAGFKSQVSKQRNLIAAAERRANLVGLEASAAATAAPAERRADFSDALAKAKAQEAGALEKQVREQEATAKKRAAEGAARRQPATFTPKVETQGQREARSGQERAAEQASLERAETPVAGPETPLAGVYAEKPVGVRQKEGEPVQRTRITYDREDKQDFKRALAAFEERFMLATTKDDIAAVKADIDTYLASYAANQDAKIDEAKRKASKNLQDLSAQRKKVAELTERLKGDLTPKRRATAEKQLKEAQEKVQEHQRRYAINASEIKLVRTDIQAARKARNDALAEANRNVVAGERLGVAEGTQRRAIGPVTRDEVMPPRTMRTGSAESRAGETTTPARMRYSASKQDVVGERTTQEVRGVQQRDVPMKSAEQAEANKIAEALRKKTPEQQAKEKKEEAAVQKEQAALQAAPEAPTGEKKPKAPRRKVQELFEDDTDLDTFEDVFYSRGATADPATTASVRAELGTVFPDIGRVQIYDSVEALVKANPQYEGRIPDDARGFVDTAGNRAFLIAENIDKGDALAVLLHEVGAHIGLKNMLGEAQYNALVKAVETWAKRNDGSIESRVAKAAQARVAAAKTPANQKADETLAYAIEEAVKAGIKPMQTKSPLGQWLSQISALFRKALEKFGLPPKTLDAQSLVDMAFGAAKMELTPAVPRSFSKTKLTNDAAKKQDAALADSVFRFLMGGPRPAEPAVLYRGVPKGADVVSKGKYIHVTPWAEVAYRSGKGSFGSPVSTDVYEFSVNENQQYYRGGALEGDPLEYTEIHNAKGMTWNQALDAAKALYKEKLRTISDLYPEERLADPEGLESAKEQLAYEASDSFKIAVFEADANNTPGVWVNKKVPAELDQNYPELRYFDETLFSRNLPTASRVADSLIAKEQGWLDKIKANLRAGRAQYIDKLAPVEEALKGGKVDDFKATQALYNLRMYDQRMHFTAQALFDGAPGLIEKTRKDGRTERLVESVPGANIKQIVDILKAKDVVREAGSPDAANKLFTLYLAAIRGERVGYDALNFGRAWAEAEIPRIDAELADTNISAEKRSVLQKRKKALLEKMSALPSAADIKAARAEIEANPTLKTAFDNAREVYNNYNRNLIQFAIDTGAISKEHGRQLLQSNDYIPYYRVRDGVAELMIGKEPPVRIGNLKDSPHLQELVGGDEAIFDFLTSSVQNTSMLLDMSMRNLAVKNLMFEFRDVGLAKIGKAKGGKTPEGAVTFKKDGEDYFAVVDTDAIGVDSELLVKGLAGIPTMFPTLVQVLGVPARLLRRVVVASPVYMARQLVRDSTAAAIASGADIAPVLSSLKQIGKPSVLERRGITGGMVFTGMPEDQTRLLKEMQAGKISLSSGLARMEALSAKVDALTREAQYESYREQGLSEMEATLMALESMNFSRRGLSPTMHMLGTLLPFFNAQIQGLDVLYRSFRGQMPFNERLQVREKLFKRGMMLFGMSMLYATLMQDDEAYQNAKVEEKYSNFFVPVPGTDQMLRVPIPFELGYIFKALPEALVNMMANEGGGEEALKALQHIAKQTVPGLSSYFLPQAVKPALEVALDHSIFTGRGLESSREAQVEPGFRYRDNTTELAKMVGEATGFSPIKMEYLIRGYTGSLGMAAMAALSAPLGSSGPESAAKRPSDLPVVGTLFQPTDASGIVDLVYEKMNKAKQVQQTYKSLIEKGRPEDAQKYLDENVDNMLLSSMAGAFTQQMGELTKYERSIRGSDMTPEEKRAALDEIRQAKIALAKAVRDQLGKTTRQAVPA